MVQQNFCSEQSLSKRGLAVAPTSEREETGKKGMQRKKIRRRKEDRSKVREIQVKELEKSSKLKERTKK